MRPIDKHPAYTGEYMIKINMKALCCSWANYTFFLSSETGSEFANSLGGWPLTSTGGLPPK